jgi:catechol 2,3-dioxygenase-like lactoylglutathione lyase family enzyme
VTNDQSSREHLARKREEIQRRYLQPASTRAKTAGRGIHHYAMISSDVERTVVFWQETLGFPLIDMFENRDLEGSTHFFFDAGNQNCIAYFDLPGVDAGPYQEVLGGHHHLSISMTPTDWSAAQDRLRLAGVEFELASGTSMYFAGPDNERLEFIADPLGEMYGTTLL